MFPSKQLDICKPEDDDRSSKLEELRKDEQEPCLSGDSEDLQSVSIDVASQPDQTIVKGTPVQSNNYEKGSPIVSVGILKDSAPKSAELKGQKLSTNAKIRLAGQWFIDTHSSENDKISEASQLSLSGLSDDEAKDIKLLLTLLDSAEKTGQRQFDHATKLIESCNYTSSAEGNAIERLVYYFSEAIREKINRETGTAAHDRLDKFHMFDVQEALMSVDASITSFHHRHPLSRICQISVVDTIIENVKKARKIHVIDLQIRNGMKYIAMLQALATQYNRHLEHVKITAIGTTAESKIKDTGRRLDDFAKSMNIPFTFKIVMVADVLDLNIDLLELNDDEEVAVYAPVFLSGLIVKPNDLEYLMGVIRKINPCITVIAEIEANHTSPAFSHRFIEALFFYGALFDSMSYCLANDDPSRRVSESVFLGQTIRNIVAADGDERTIRHISVDVWRTYFARFGMVEIELSTESLSEAKLLIDSLDCESCCSIRVHGRCLLIDWKDIPIFSVSAWKFV
ncbi:unnamed protein product [Lactuca virosa]|uniref:DELLA protein n=1 Tax=Lactuca virosa TaxID=75947 RepID=A0AAU9PN49_9ASTR|nr:unnamed protein product [Lactuca virosa]